MRKLLLLAALLLALGTPAFSSFLPGPPPVDCPMNYEPVRCSDGVVYSNTCLANAAGATGCSPVPFWEW